MSEQVVNFIISITLLKLLVSVMAIVGVYVLLLKFVTYHIPPGPMTNRIIGMLIGSVLGLFFSRFYAKTIRYFMDISDRSIFAAIFVVGVMVNIILTHLMYKKGGQDVPRQW